MESRCIRSLLIAGACIAVLSSPLLADFTLTWSEIGTGYTVANVLPARDQERLWMNDMIVDADGVVYTTAQMSAYNSNISIFTPGGGTYTKQDIDLTALGYSGGVTKLVLGADNKVYALQNWYEIEFHGDIVCRLLRINANGTVDVLYTSNGTKAQVLADITSVPEGAIYAIRASGQDPTSSPPGAQFDMFHRYRLYGVGAPVWESSPINGSYEQGYGLDHYHGVLEYTGTSNGIDAFWALTASGQTWGGTAMGWQYIHSGVTNKDFYRRDDDLADVGNVIRNAKTVKSAYDPVRKKLWTAGRSALITSDRAWADTIPAFGSATKNLFIDTRRQMNQVDLGGGNWGQTFILRTGTSDDRAAVMQNFYGASGLANTVTLYGKFRLDQYPAGYTGCIMAAAGYPWNAANGGNTNAVIGVKILNESSIDNLVLWNYTSNEKLVTLGPVTSSTAWHEVRIVANSTGSSDSAKCWYGLNGAIPAKLFDAAVTAGAPAAPEANHGPGAGFDGMLAACGAAVRYYSAGATNARVTFDEMAWCVGEYTGTADVANWPDTTPVFYGEFANGSVRPQDFRTLSLVSRWSGDPTKPMMFQGVGVTDSNPVPITGPYEEVIFALSGNDQDVTKVPNGNHWVGSLEVNPCSGSAWMSIVGGKNFRYSTASENVVENEYNQYSNPLAPMGQFVIAKPNDAYLTQKANGPGALYTTAIVGSYFTNSKIYALVLDLTTGSYKTYVADNPSSGECCPVPFADTDGDKDVDMADFGKWQRCYTQDSSKFDAANCSCFDTDYNNLINDADLFEFEDCASGAGVLSDCN